MCDVIIERVYSDARVCPFMDIRVNKRIRNSEISEN